MAELLPCPFCGSEAVIEKYKELSYIVKCTKCPCNFGRQWYSRKFDIKKAWNTRTQKERGAEE